MLIADLLSTSTESRQSLLDQVKYSSGILLLTGPFFGQTPRLLPGPNLIEIPFQSFFFVSDLISQNAENSVLALQTSFELGHVREGDVVVQFIVNSLHNLAGIIFRLGQPIFYC
jgi:hypothetical protein